MKKKKLLLMLKLPPPVTGVTKMCCSVLENGKLFKEFNTKVIGLSYAKDVKSTGGLTPAKLMKLFLNIAKTKFTVLTFWPDLVYFVPSLTGSAFLRDFLFILILKFFRRNIIFHLHGTGLKETSQKSKFYKSLYLFAFNNSEIITLSEKLREDLEFLSPNKIHILPNGIAPLPTSLATAPPAPFLATAPPAPLLVKVGGEVLQNLLFVSNFYDYKGIPELIELLAEVHKRGHPFTCKIAGEENYITATDLQKLIDANGLTEKVKYVGSVKGDNLLALYEQSDIFIYPTKKDAMPLVILEAMRAGLAILSNPIGAITDMIGYNPWTLPTPENLATLLTNPDLILKLGEQNRKTFEEKFTIEKFYSGLMQILINATNEEGMKYEV
ncbi:MAG: glycosyltransferase family 4 protein [Ignavibacteria bacterium]|nr:glycosyltransferase family 4 protein [Ignavibacteria bacterium]